MNLEKIYREEDLFPREITSYEERDYGFLFYKITQWFAKIIHFDKFEYKNSYIIQRNTANENCEGYCYYQNKG